MLNLPTVSGPRGRIVTAVGGVMVLVLLCLFQCRGFDWPPTQRADANSQNPSAPAAPPAFSISGLNPADGAISVPATASITVNFSLTVNTGTLTYDTATAACGSSRLQLSPDNFVNCIGMGSPSWNATQDSLTITPLAALLPNTTYRVRISTGLSATTGQVLSATYTSAGFTTVGPATLAITATNPSDAATNIGLTPSVIITFNGQMNTGTISANAAFGPCSGTVQLSPDNFVNCVGLISPSWSGPASQVTFALASALTPGTFYRFKITTGVAGTGGEVLAADVTTPTGFATTINSPLAVQAFGSSAQNIIFWQNVSGAASYNIYFGLTAGVTVGTGTLISGVTSPYVHTGRTNGTTYYYIVAGVNGAIVGQPSPEVTATALAFRTVFVTSASYTGNLGGLAGADSYCAGRATAAGLTGTYKAYLSDAADDAACRVLGLSGKLAANCGLPYPIDLTGIGPYQNRIAQVVNVSLDSLIYGKAPTTATCAGGGPSLLNAIAYDEIAASVGPAVVLTGTQCGADDGNNCSNWTDGLLGNGRSGIADSTSATWATNSTLAGCLAGGRLYCVQR